MVYELMGRRDLSVAAGKSLLAFKALRINLAGAPSKSLLNVDRRSSVKDWLQAAEFAVSGHLSGAPDNSLLTLTPSTVGLVLDWLATEDLRAPGLPAVTLRRGTGRTREDGVQSGALGRESVRECRRRHWGGSAFPAADGVMFNSIALDYWQQPTNSATVGNRLTPFVRGQLTRGPRNRRPLIVDQSNFGRFTGGWFSRIDRLSTAFSCRWWKPLTGDIS